MNNIFKIDVFDIPALTKNEFDNLVSLINLNLSVDQQSQFIEDNFIESRRIDFKLLEIFDWYFPITDFKEFDDPNESEFQEYKLSDTFQKDHQEFIKNLYSKYGLELSLF